LNLVAAERVDVRTAAEMWRCGDLIIDVRTPEEYATGHIAGALNVPIQSLPLAARDLPPGPVLTACSRGGRASRAADLLDLDGRSAFVIDGGTVAWEGARLPIARGAEPGSGGRRRR
jgi:rhodanese-related sulfurtransferase